MIAVDSDDHCCCRQRMLQYQVLFTVSVHDPVTLISWDFDDKAQQIAVVDSKGPYRLVAAGRN